MARTVYVPEAQKALRFPDGTTDQQIVDFVRSRYARPAPAPVEQDSGISALSAGFYGSLGRAEAAAGKAAQGMGIDWLAKDLFDRSRANEAYVQQYKPDVGSISDIRGLGDLASFAGSTIGQSATDTAIGVGGSILGGMAAGALTGAQYGAGAGTAVEPGGGTVVGGGLGAIIGGIVGGAMAALPGFVGGNLQRQAQEQGKTLEETSGYEATIGAAAQAPLDAAFDTLIAGKFKGAGVALDVVKKSFLKEVAATAAKGAATEALTEPAQQAIEIAQANPEKLLDFGPEVQSELLNAAAGGALAGGIIGGVAEPVGGAVGKYAEGKKEEAKKQLAADITTAAQGGEQMKRFAEINSGVEKLAAQQSIGQLKLGKVQVDPTPENGLKAPLTRFQILDGKNQSIAEFSDPVHATDAVNTYSKISGKKINLIGVDGGRAKQIPTVDPKGKADPSAAFPKTVPITTPEETRAAAKAVAGPAITQAAPVAPQRVAKVVKKADIATRIQPIPAADIPYESRVWDDAKKTAVSVAGKSKIVDYGGRKMMVVDVNGTNVPFYLSSGLAGKEKVPSGKWYPFFGIGPDGWINKTSQEEVANYYGDEDLKRVAQTLDATVGDIRANNSIPRIGLEGAHTSFINSGLDPAENNSADTLDKVTRNIKSVIDKVRANKPVEQIAQEETLVEEPTTEGAVAQAVGEQPVGVSDQAPAEAQPAVAEPLPPPPAPTNPEFDTIAAPPVVDQNQQEVIRKAITDRKNAIGEGVRAALKRYNLKDVDTKFVPALMDKMGKVLPAQGSEAIVDDKSIVKLATDIYDPNLTVEQMVNKVVDALNHESIHSLFDLGLIRPAERQILLNAVETAKVPGKKYTYLDYAKLVYDPSRPGLEIYSDPNLVREEAVAEMFRDWRNRGTGATTNTRGLFNRVIDALRNVFNVMRRNSYEDIFKSIESGEVGLRERSPVPDSSSPAVEKTSIAPEMPKLAVAPVYPYGQRVPEVNAAQINNTLDHITYGAGVNMLDRVFNSKTASTIIPERFRPSKEAYANFIRRFADRMLPVGQMIDYIKQNGGTVPDAFDAYMAEELMHGKVSDSLETRENGLYTPLMEYIKNSGLSQQEFEDYLYARHAIERNDRMRKINPDADPSVGSGMTDEEAEAILASVDRSPRREQFLAAESMFRAIIDDTNSLRVESGLTPDFDNLVDENGNPVEVEQYQYYAPLRGFADETITEGEIDENLRARIGRGFKIRGREDMRAMGRSSKATDILAHAMLQNSEAVIRAAKNKVGQTFLNLVEANPELAAQYGVEVMTAGKKPLKRYISSKGVVKTMVDPMYKNSDDVMVVKRAGQEVPIKIDNAFLQKALLAKKSGSPDIAEKAINFLQKGNRFLAAMSTAYNPEFMLVNFPRDLQTALVNITQYEIDGIQKKVLKDALPAVKGVYKMLRDPSAVNEWTDWYKMFKADGGATGGFMGSFSLEDRLRKLEKLAQDTSGQPTYRLKQAFDGVKGWLEDANGAFENAVRLSVYKNLVEAGLTRERAAQAAKNLTVNFDKRGEFGPIMNSLYLFYNASVQGTMSMMMAASRSKKVRRIIGGIVVFGMLQDAINSLMSDEDDDGKKIYDKIPDYKLQTNIILMDPFGITKNGYYAIPLPYGFNAFYNMGRSMTRSARGEYKTSEALTSMASTFVDAFNPVGGTESLLNFIAPTALDPIVALSINQDFTGRRIYPEPFPGSVPKADSQMYWSTTSPIFKNTADFLNWATGGTEYVPGMIDLSPDVMEYMYDYMLGGVGAFGRRLFDTATNTVPAALSGDLQEIDINNFPVFRKLYGNVSERVSFEDYFNKVNHVLARGEEMKSAMREGDPERIKSVRARFGDEISIYPTVKSLANRRNKLAGELRKLRDNPKMPPEQKRRRQELLQNQIEDITNRVNKLYEDKIGNKYPSLFS